MAEYLLDFFSHYYTWGYIGFIIGSSLAAYNMTRNGYSLPAAIAIITAGIYGGLVGSRTLFLVQYDPHFLLSDPIQTIVFWQGGLSWLGGPIGAMIVYYVVFKALRHDPWRGMGPIAPGLALAHAIARTGCLIRGCCYGTPTNLPWAIYSDVLDTHVHPTQLYSMLAEGVVAVVLQLLHRKESRRAYLYPLYILLLSAHRFLLENLRGDPSGPAIIRGLRFYQSVTVIWFALGLVLLLLLWKGKKLVPAAAAVVAVLAGSLFFFRPSATLGPAPAVVHHKTCLVATREMFQPALADWIDWRRSQGWKISLMAWPDAPTFSQIREWTASSATPDTVAFLLVGDCADESAGQPPWHMPTAFASEGFPTDSAYADLDSDGLPEFAVGRMPVRDAKQLRKLVRKTKVYESGTTRASECPKGLLWVGVPEMESTLSEARDHMVNLLPADIDWKIVSADEPKEEPFLFLESAARHYDLAVVVSEGYVDRVVTAGPAPWVSLTAANLSQLSSTEPKGVLCLIACETGLFSSPGTSFAEQWLLHPGGPVGVIASGAKLHRSVNYLLARRMAALLVRPELPKTAGEFMLGWQKSVLEEVDLSNYNDSLTFSLSQRMPDPHRLRAEAASYVYLGDPLVAFLNNGQI